MCKLPWGALGFAYVPLNYKPHLKLPEPVEELKSALMEQALSIHIEFQRNEDGIGFGCLRGGPRYPEKELFLLNGVETKVFPLLNPSEYHWSKGCNCWALVEEVDDVILCATLIASLHGTILFNIR